MATINGSTVISCTISLPASENWRADVVYQGDALAGTVLLDIDGVQFSGSVLRSGAFAGRGQARVVGGRGGLSKELAAKNYANGPTVKQIVADILSGAGETLSSAADGATLAKAFPKWERVQGAASEALRDVLAPSGAEWRIEPDGTVWVGVASFPEGSPATPPLDENYLDGVFEFGDSVELRPVFSYKGFPIRFVQHQITAEGSRSRLYIHSPADLFERSQNRTRRTVDYAASYPARVSKQNSDGTLALVADDPEIKGTGLDRVPYRLGVPGTVKVSNGQRVRVAFDAHDPSRPYCYAWEGGACDELSLAGGADFVALAALVKARLDIIQQKFDTHTHVTSCGSGTGSAAVTTMLITPLAPVAATKVKAE